MQATRRTFRRMSLEHATRARQFERLANARVDPPALPDQLLEALARAVPFDAYGWQAIDPRSLLPTRDRRTIPYQRAIDRRAPGSRLRATSFCTSQRSGRVAMSLPERHFLLPRVNGPPRERRRARALVPE